MPDILLGKEMTVQHFAEQIRTDQSLDCRLIECNLYKTFLSIWLFGKGSQPSRHAGGYEADRVEHQNFFERDVAVSAVAVIHVVSPPFLKGRCRCLTLSSGDGRRI